MSLLFLCYDCRSNYVLSTTVAVCFCVCRFIRAFAEAFDELEVPAPVVSDRERERAERRERRTPPSGGIGPAEGVPPAGVVMPAISLSPARGATMAPAAMGVSDVGGMVGMPTAVDGGDVGGGGGGGEVVSEVGAGTALLAQLAQDKRNNSPQQPAAAPLPAAAVDEDPLAWLTKPALKPVALPASASGEDDGADALSFLMAAGQ